MRGLRRQKIARIADRRAWTGDQESGDIKALGDRIGCIPAFGFVFGRIENPAAMRARGRKLLAELVPNAENA